MSKQQTNRVKVSRTKRFRKSFKRLGVDLQHLVDKKIAILQQHPDHPSLRAHRHRAGADLWECYISVSLRLLYQYRDNTLLLEDVGTHTVVERAHLRQFLPP